MTATEPSTQRGSSTQQFISNHPLVSIAVMTVIFFGVMVVLAYGTITVLG